MSAKHILVCASLLFLCACNQIQESTTEQLADIVQPEANDLGYWVLYRNSTIDKSMRIHVASFDSIEGGNVEANYEYNRENCESVSQTLGSRVGVTADYWCERGLAESKG